MERSMRNNGKKDSIISSNTLLVSQLGVFGASTVVTDETTASTRASTCDEH